MATPDYNRLWEDLKKKQDSATNAYYQTQRDAIKTNANEQRRSAEISHQKSMRSLPAQMARLGLKGTGAAESSLVQANNAYEELLNSIRSEELATERDLYATASANAMKSTRTGGTGDPEKEQPEEEQLEQSGTIVQNPYGTELYRLTYKMGKDKKPVAVYDRVAESEAPVSVESRVRANALLQDPNMAYASLLQDMYKQGKISRETYIARLAGLGLELDE
jgi:hypothetical protein